MSGKLLNLFLRFSGFIFNLKQKIVDAKSWTRALPYVFLLFLVEIVFLVVSLPLYLVVSPKKLQESGFIFPNKEKEPEHFHIYLVRRKISLATIFSAGGIVLLKFIFVGLVSAYLLGAQALLAASQDWNFSTAGDYTYNSSKIAVTGGVAQLVDQGGGGSCTGTATACDTFVSSPTCVAQVGCSWNAGDSGATINSDFSSDTSGWTYADWGQGGGEVNINGGRISSGGNPGGYINITAPIGKDDELGGYWRQSFITAQANPTVTMNFDWSVLQYDSSPPPITFKLYAFVDTSPGVPTVGQEVWSSGEITATDGWLSITNLDVSSKVTTAGTYYLKVAMWLETPSSNSGPFTVGFDNVQLNWSKTDTCSGTATVCNTYVSSPTCVAQGGCSWTPVAVYPTDKPTINPTSSLVPSGVTSWNSFTETATKGTGEIYYQLSDDDGVTWKYWNGSGWAAVSLPTDYNIASVINTNINTFSASAGKIMWKAFLSSDGSQQITLDNIAIGYTQNAAPVLQSVTASQNTATGYVHVDYNLRDDNNDPNTLTTYEYSLTGAFTGEQSAMTPVPTDPAHDGVSGLSTSASGVAHTFVWNAAADLGNVFSSTVYVRLRANDGIVNSNYIISSSISVDYVNPIVSSVTAVQASSSANVIIGYNLSDDTTDDILVELQASSDGGATWDVPVSSVSGDVGASVTSGNGKTITWNAGSDFANQENNNMMVRVRAKDKYQNQGANVDSSSFVIDNRAPVIATPVDLLAQPLAGATSVLVGGSFSEGNPNTNDFYVAIDGADYGSAQAGDSDTATPSDKSLSVGTTLKGNNYVSAVKIEHTDDFGLMTANENTSPNSAYKYVKPYTPPAPTISNPGEDSLSVGMNKHTNEVDGLEYAVFESTQNLYVQSDGSLGSDAYWQPIGIVTVTGLSQPISQYSFKVKSRNSSDASNAVTSESDLSSGASSDYQSPQIIINSAAQTTDGTKYVVINYTGTDYRNQTNNLVKYEYSLNGTDWLTMTEKLGGASNGVVNLPFTSGGANLVFEWDVGLDLPSVEDTSVYVRLESNDGVTNSNTAVSSAFIVNTAGPVISNILVSQTIGTDNVVITYDLADGAGANNTVVLTFSDDSGSTYNVAAPSKTGDVGAGVTAGLARSVTWNVGADLADQEKTTMRVKIAATDSYGNEGVALESADFEIDTKAPVVSDVTASQVSGSALVTVNYNLVDLNSSNVEFSVSADSGSTWTITTTTYTGDVGPGQTAGSKIFNWNAVVDFPDQELDTMRVRVRALDTFGHQGGFVESADFSINTKVLSISDITVTQIVGTKTVSIHYDLNKTAIISLDISSDGGATWDVATTTLTGNVNNVVTAGDNKTITWNPAIDFSNEEKTSMRVRLSGIDAFGIVSAYYESSNFSVDTAAPLGLLSLAKFGSTNDSVTLNWSSGISDAHFAYYELWHGSNQTDVINRNNTAQKWSTANDANLDTITTISTIITGLNLTNDYFVKIWAIDEYGNGSTITALNVYSAPTSTPPTEDVVVVTGGGGGDSTSPNKPILSPIKTPTNVNKVTISGLAEPFARVNLYNNGKFVATLNDLVGEDGKFEQFFDLDEGIYVLTVKAFDSANNFSESSESVILEIITKAPDAPIVLSPQNDEQLVNETPTLVGVSVPFASIEIVLDGGKKSTVEADKDGAWQFKLPADLALKDGTHKFVLKATDLAGNISAEKVLNLNKVAPVVEVQPTEIVIEGQVVTPITQPVSGEQGGAGIATVPIETIVPIIVSATLPPAELVRQNIEAVELAGVPVPEVTSVQAAVANDLFTFTGSALPNQEVLVYLHSDQALIYRTKADVNGVWQFNHSQADIELTPGQHSIYAVAIDPSAKVRSKPSLVSTFTVEKNFWVSLFDKLNLQTTSITLAATLLVMVWLYGIKKREIA